MGNEASRTGNRKRKQENRTTAGNGKQKKQKKTEKNSRRIQAALEKIGSVC